MQFLILYSSCEGQTKRVAKAFADEFENSGHEVFLSAIGDPGYCDPGSFDAALLCAPIHMGEYPQEFIRYIDDWCDALSNVPNVLVTVSLLIACKEDKEQREARSYPLKLIRKTGWEPGRIYNVAGALNYPQYDFFKSWVMKQAAAAEGWSTDTDKCHEFTDWVGLRAFADEFTKVVGNEAA